MNAGSPPVNNGPGGRLHYGVCWRGAPWRNINRETVRDRLLGRPGTYDTAQQPQQPADDNAANQANRDQQHNVAYRGQKSDDDEHNEKDDMQDHRRHDTCEHTPSAGCSDESPSGLASERLPEDHSAPDQSREKSADPARQATRGEHDLGGSPHTRDVTVWKHISTSGQKPEEASEEHGGQADDDHNNHKRRLANPHGHIHGRPSSTGTVDPIIPPSSAWPSGGWSQWRHLRRRVL